MRRRVIEAVLLEKAQRGWRCEMAFYVQSHTQSTDQLCNVAGGGKTVAAALWSTYQAVRRERRRVRSIPGPFWNTEEA